MKHWRLLLICLSLSAVVFTIEPSVAFSCSCAEPPSVEEELEDKDAVFTGRVLDIYNPQEGAEAYSSGEPVYVLFDVHDSWKGVEQTRAVVTTALESASCGFPFEAGEEYVVYALNDEQFLSTNLCERTAHLTDAAEDIEVLGENSIELEEVDYDLEEVISEVNGGSQGNAFWPIAIIFILVISGAAFVFIRKRRKY